MIIRFVQFRSNDPGALRVAYERVVISTLRSTAGCISATLLQSGADPEQCVSMTLWRSSEDAQRYEQSGLFQQLVDAMQPYIADSTEWRIQLGDDLTVRYEPVSDGPVVQQYAVQAGGEQNARESPASYVRIVSHRVRPEASAQFRQVYENEIIPALRRQPACRHAYLVTAPDDLSTMLSVTVWADHDGASQYERSGSFAALLSKVEPMLTNLAQWKLDVEHGSKARVATSDDVSVDGYSLLVGGRFAE